MVIDFSCCSRQLQTGISTLQYERGSEALARNQVHDQEQGMSKSNDDDYTRDKENVLLIRNVRDMCGRGF